MPIFEYKNNKIYYVIEGEGTPLLLLNGIMMTTASWEPIAEPLKKNNTLIRLDLLDQGQSTKQDKSYTIADQADLVASFILFLGYKKMNVVGISYGGYVALNLASRYSHLVDRMVIFNSAADVDKRAKEMFKQFMHVSTLKDPYAFYLTTIPLFYSETFYSTQYEWMEKREALLVKFFENEAYLKTIYRLAESCLTHDVQSELHRITAKVMVVGGEEDTLIPLPKQAYIAENVKDGYLVSMGKTGHVSLYENPTLFTTLIYGFINNPTLEFQI